VVARILMLNPQRKDGYARRSQELASRYSGGNPSPD
jgi:hypothetical protein